MEKVVVPLTTRRSVLHQLIAWLERFALPVLGLTGPGLMAPGPVKAENTAIRGGDDHGPLVGRLAGEDLATGQASLIICFVVGTRGDVDLPARWAWLWWVQSHGVNPLGAVRGLESCRGDV